MGLNPSELSCFYRIMAKRKKNKNKWCGKQLPGGSCFFDGLVDKEGMFRYNGEESKGENWKG